MADRIISAEVRIDGKDAGVAAMFDRINAKMERMGKTKVSPEFSNLAGDLSKAEAQLKAIEKVSAGRLTADLARRKVEQAKAQVASMKAAVEGVEAPTKRMQAAIEKATAAYGKSLEALRRQATALQTSKQAASELGVALDRLPTEQARIQSAIDRTTAAMERQVAVEKKATQVTAARHKQDEQRREFIERHGVGHLIANTGAAYFGAHGIVRGLETATETGAGVQHAKVLAQQAGIPQPEIMRMSDQALMLSARYRNVDQESLIELAKEARSALLHPDEVREIMPALAAAKSVLSSIDKSGEASSGLASLVKGAESIGAAQSPERLTKLIDSYIRSIQVMGKTIDPSQIYDFDKGARLAGARLSDRFLMTTGLSLSQEMSGATAGKGVNEAVSQMTSGLGKRTVAATQLMNLGLVDRKDLRFNKIGEVSGVRKGVLHPVAQDALLASDPDLWTYNVLLPAMQKHGMTNIDDQIAAIRQIFSGSKTAQDIVGKLITQRPSFEAHAVQYGNATGLKAADQNTADAMTGWAGLTTQLRVFSGVLAEPAMQTAGTTLNSIASAIGSFSMRLNEFSKDHPDLAPAMSAGAGAAGLAGAGSLAYFATRGAARLFGRWAGFGGEAAAAGEGAAGLGGAAAVAPAGLALPIMAGAAIGLGTGAILVYGADTKKAIAHGGTPDKRQDPSDVLPGLDGDDYKPRRAPSWPYTPTPRPVPLDDPWMSGERQAIEKRAYDAAQAFRRDPEGARGEAMMRMPAPIMVTAPAPAPAVAPLPTFAQGPVDVTGRVQADAEVHVIQSGVVRIDVQASDGLLAHVGFDGRMTQLDVGRSDVNAGRQVHPGAPAGLGYFGPPGIGRR